jgi:predicted DNA-binding protein YlxM (UPF0122 family)
MSELPIPWQGGRPSRSLARATKATAKTELAIYEAELSARFHAEVDQIESRAIGDAVKGALEEEMRVYDEALELARDSLAKRELVGRLVAIQSRVDSNRIARRFEA